MQNIEEKINYLIGEAEAQEYESLDAYLAGDDYVFIRNEFFNYFLDIISSGSYAIASDFEYNLTERSIAKYNQFIGVLVDDDLEGEEDLINNAEDESEADNVYEEAKKDINLYNSVLIDLKHLTRSAQKKEDHLLLRVDELQFEIDEKEKTQHVKILKVLIELEFLDLALPTSKDPEEIIQKIGRIYSFLYENSDGKNVYIKKALQKSVFLIRKIWINHPTSKLTLSLYDKEFDLEKVTLEQDLQDILEVTRLEKRDKLYKEEKSILEEIRNRNKNKDLSRYIEIKLEKDGVNDFDNLFSRIEALSGIGRSFDNGSQVYDTTAQNLNQTFCYNNLVSLAAEFLENELDSTELISEEILRKLSKHVDSAYNIVCDLRIKNAQVENYFSYYKYALFNLLRLEHLIKSRKDNKESADTIGRDYKEKVKAPLISLISCFHVFKRFQKYQFSFENSVVSDSSIFIYSCVNSTLSYYLQEDRIRELQFRASVFEARLKEIKMLEDTSKTMEDTEEKFNSNLSRQLGVFKEYIAKAQDESSKKTTEILSIFAAIVVFSLGSLQLFQNFTQIIDALFLMVVFALATVAIYVSIHVVNNKKSNSLSTIIVIAFLILVSFLTGIKLDKDYFAKKSKVAIKYINEKKDACPSIESGNINKVNVTCPEKTIYRKIKVNNTKKTRPKTEDTPKSNDTTSSVKKAGNGQ